MRDERRINGYDGTPLHVEITGEGPATVVFCATLGFGARFFAPVVSHIGAGLRLVSIDGRGQGRSGVPHDPTRVRILDFARDVHAVLDALERETGDPGPIALVGHGLGAVTAVEAWLARPVRVQAAVLIGFAPEFGAPIPRIVRSVVGRALSTGAAATLVPDGAARALFGAGVFREGLRQRATYAHMCRGEAWASAMDDAALSDPRVLVRAAGEAAVYSVRHVLPELAIPVQLVYGEHDALVPERTQADVRRLLPKAETVIVRRGSHFAPLEQPGLTALAIERFVRRAFDLPLAAAG